MGSSKPDAGLARRTTFRCLRGGVPPVDSDCSYYLGERLFLELLGALGRLQFSDKLQELYLVALPVREAGGDPPGIAAAMRQVFADQASIVEKHWSGALNAPDNRPFDEGVSRASHDVVQWDHYPSYDGHSVTFNGTLLDGAVLTAGNHRTGKGQWIPTLHVATRRCL